MKLEYQLTNNVYKISDICQVHGFKAILVGGMVRDYFLSKINNVKFKSKDIDIEVYGVQSYNELEHILSQYGKTNIVGKSFGVIKLTIDDEEFDISLPRRESTIGKKHTDLEIVIDGELKYNDAFKRRDFTMNAIGYDINERKFIDPFNGINDIKNGVINIVDEYTFVEDPLRLYRAIQFASRFNMTINSKTFKLLKNMVDNGIIDNLPKERIFEEFNKMFLKSKKPSIGFNLMKNIGLLHKYFNELSDLIRVQQDSKWHPEGDVWTHTMMVIDEMSETMPDVDNVKKITYFYACLCHDLGKVSTTKFIDGKWRARGHEKAGIEPTLSFMKKLTNDKDLINDVVKLVEYHLRPTLLYSNKSSMGAIKRLARKVNLLDVVRVNRADHLGRTTEKALNRENSVYDYFMDIIENKLNFDMEGNQVYSEPKLITGKDLIDLGIKPGPEFKKILEFIYIEQLEGRIQTKKEGLELLNTLKA